MLFASQDFNYRHSGARASANPESLRRLIISGCRVRSLRSFNHLDNAAPELGVGDARERAS